MPLLRLRRRPWLAKLLLLTAGLLVSLAIAEGVVRLFFPYARDTAIPGHLFVIDDLLGWKFRPGGTSVQRTRDFTVEYVINASGFRDRSRLDPRRAAAHRTVVYGDSLVFGWGVAQPDRFTDLLEGEIAGLEVWNHGIPGYGLDQEVLSYERDSESLPFDEAMFFVSAGTLGRIHSGFIYTKYKPTFSYDAARGLRLEPVPAGKNRAVSFVYEVFSPFYLPYFLQNRLATLRGAPAAPATTNPEPRHLDVLATKILERARDDTRRRNQRMSVLVGDVWRTDRDDLRRWCEDNDVDFLEVPLEIAETSLNGNRMDLVLGPHDRHWNAKANRLLADALERKIRPQPGRGPASYR